MNAEQIANRLKQNEIQVSEEVPEQLCLYLNLLTEWNQHMDLTAVTEPEDMLDRHFVDSLTILKTDLMNDVTTMIDVGTGAGFPGLVLAIARPDLQVTLLDAQQKRLTFLDAVCDQINVTNTTLVHARAEDGGQNRILRERFDLAIARAVAPLNMLYEFLLPFVRIGGKAVCLKGPALWSEMEKGRDAAAILGAEVLDPIECPVAGQDWQHFLLPAQKIRPTPLPYPRRAGIPKQKPLAEHVR